jgi:hypothetical protein
MLIYEGMHVAFTCSRVLTGLINFTMTSITLVSGFQADVTTPDG